jgi:hypothetical protein
MFIAPPPQLGIVTTTAATPLRHEPLRRIIPLLLPSSKKNMLQGYAAAYLGAGLY